MEEPERQPLFTPANLRLFRATAVLLSAVVMTGLVVLIVWVLGLLVSFFYNLLLPLSIAGVIALVLYPAIGVMKRHLRMSHGVAVSVLMIIFGLALGIVVTLVVPSAAEQASTLWNSLPEIATRISRKLSRMFPTLWSLGEQAVENWKAGEALETITPDVAEQVMSYMSLLIGMAMVPFFLFFALLSGKGLREKTQQLLEVFTTDTQKVAIYLIDVFVGYVTTFFQGQFIIAMIMGLMLATGFTLIGLQAAIAVGLLLGLLNIVPYLGTIVGLLIIVPLAYLQPGAGLELLALTLVVFAVVQVVESWLLTPKIMGERSGLHPAVVVISIFFWGTALDGLIGMILAVPLTAFVVALWRHFRFRLAQQLVSSSVELAVAPDHYREREGEPEEATDRAADTPGESRIETAS